MDHAVRRHEEHELDVIDLRDEPIEPFRGWDAEYDEHTRDTVERLRRADALFLASPVYNGSYSSMLKNLFEHTPQDALKGQVAGILLAGGGSKSFLQVRSHIEQMLTYFEVHTVPKSVYGMRDELEEGVPHALDERIGGLVDLVVDTARRLRAHDEEKDEKKERHEEGARTQARAGKGGRRRSTSAS